MFIETAKVAEAEANQEMAWRNSANDNNEAKLSAVARNADTYPPNALALIERVGRSVNQFGRARQKDWILRFEPRSRLSADPLTGWTSGTDPLRHVTLRFATLEAAIRFAERQGLPYRVNGSALAPAATLQPLEALRENAA